MTPIARLWAAIQQRPHPPRGVGPLQAGPHLVEGRIRRGLRAAIPPGRSSAPPAAGHGSAASAAHTAPTPSHEVALRAGSATSTPATTPQPSDHRGALPHHLRPLAEA